MPSFSLELFLHWSPVLYWAPTDPFPFHYPKGDQPWVNFGIYDAKAETPVLWPPHEKSWLIGKDSDAGRDWEQEEKGTTEEEMAGWHHRLDGHEFEWTPGDGDGQGGLECCDSWGRKESDTTEWLNWRLTCGVPWPEIKPVAPVLGVHSLSHCTTREVPRLFSWIHLSHNSVLFTQQVMTSLITNLPIFNHSTDWNLTALL